MSQYPNRNWGKIYTQMWNLAMKEPITKFVRYGNANQSNNRQTEGKNREKYCWKFNKNKCKNKNCDWEHRCKYCDGWGHGLYNCYKKLAAKNGNATPSGNTTVPNQNGNGTDK